MNKTATAYSQYPRCIHNKTIQWENNGCSGSKNVPVYMGYSVRTPEWRYTSWMPWDRKTTKVDWSKKPYAIELYDHSGDPESENDHNQSDVENVAAQHEDIVKQLQAQLKTFFKKE